MVCSKFELDCGCDLQNHETLDNVKAHHSRDTPVKEK
jgi:hypothetical protein